MTHRRARRGRDAAADRFGEAQEWFAPSGQAPHGPRRRVPGRSPYDVWLLALLGDTYGLVCPLLDQWTRMADFGVAAAEAAGDVEGQCWLRLARCEIALMFELPGAGFADAERAAVLAAGSTDERLVTAADLHLGARGAGTASTRKARAGMSAGPSRTRPADGVREGISAAITVLLSASARPSARAGAPAQCAGSRPGPHRASGLSDPLPPG